MGLMEDFIIRTRDGSFEIAFSPEAMGRIMREIFADSSDSPGEIKETGGILLGNWETEGETTKIKVYRSSGPGSNSIRQSALFSPDFSYYSNRAGYHFSRNGWTYLGEWHRHPGTFHCLSSVDMKMAQELLKDEKWPFLLLPVLNNENGSATVTVNIVRMDEKGKPEAISADRLIIPDQYREGYRRMKAYIDCSWMERFAEGEEETCRYAGIMNPGESWVFLPVPGPKNAVLHFVRQGNEIELPDRENTLTVLFGPEGKNTAFSIVEGEPQEIPIVAVKAEEDVFERNRGFLETLQLFDKKILLVGCGSVGSTIASELARAGVGHFILADPDILEPANVSRHQAGLHHLGRKKVNAVKEIIQSINPRADVTVHPVDVCGNPETIDLIKDTSEKCDLLICTTDTDESRIFVNDISLATGVPSIQAGLHERASSGIVQVVKPGRNACFLCHRETILKSSPRRRGTMAYSEQDAGETVFVSPGLSAQINLVSEIAVLRALETLGTEKHVENQSAEENSDEEIFTDLSFVNIKSDKSQDSSEYIFNPAISTFRLEPSDKCPACGANPFFEQLDEDFHEA